MQTLTPIDKYSNELQLTILVVEDDEDNLIYISSAFALLNCHCISIQDPQKCLALAQKYQPDLIILDIKMPILSGIELIQMLKLNLLTQNIPVIAATALAREKEKRLIMNAGFSHYLLKPFLLEDLEEIVHSQISKQFSTTRKIAKLV